VGGYVHQSYYEFMQRDAKALGVKYLFHNIYSLEHHVLVPAIKRRLEELSMSTEGDYVTLRTRLADCTKIFDVNINPAHSRES